MIKINFGIYLREDDIKEIDDEHGRNTNVIDGADILLKRFISIANIMDNAKKGSSDWFLTGKSQKDAMKKKVISEGVITKNANSLMANKLINDYPIIVSKIWNDDKDYILCRNYMQSNINLFSYGVCFSVEHQEQAKEYVAEIIKYLISELSPRIIKVETNDYTLEEHQVFPDRLSVGWMFYTDSIYDEKKLGLGNQMHTMTKNGQAVGTLFLSKLDFFDGSNENDIALANDLEITLAGHGVLPTFSTIF
ncbi:immunity 52 family protein [Candidatus Symbiopectobacterium sp. NZEC127]|uniref:Imm52 family immunity protein n=1 Tax=Candidatus Symbiopectobacterium sp. NZEC127 TaxID=2820472 RepID=UPI0022260D11|nr:Imm52 family immunity protein [Candidatus Symbiopectobacterium sp. NZEC127]MCW2485463.1 immunity 52 family protein [Candidatus Symbiopectobacterium sp. NZEC127]